MEYAYEVIEILNPDQKLTHTINMKIRKHTTYLYITPIDKKRKEENF